MRLKVLLRTSVVLLILSPFTSARAQQKGPLFLMWDERGRYGFMDVRGTVVIKPQFDGALPFTEGLAAVSLNKQWGFIDESGKVVVPLSYFAIAHFSDGVAAVTLKEGDARPCGYLDHTGQFVIKPQNRFTCGDFKEGFAVVGVYNESAGEDFDGYMNKTGELAIGGGYLRADPFSEGLGLVVDLASPVFDFSTSVFINARGQTVIDLRNYAGSDNLSDKYVPSGPFSEGLAEVGIKTPYLAGYSRFGYVNKEGKVVFVLPEKFRAEGPFRNGRALVFEEKSKSVPVVFSNGERIRMEVDVSAYGYVDKSGRLVIPTRFSEAEDFSDGLAVVKTGKPQPTNRRDLAGSAAESYFDGDEGNWLCIDTAGRVLIKRCGEPLSREELTDRFPQFGEQFGTGFINGLFFSKTHLPGERQALYGYMNRSGRYVWLQPHGAGVTPQMVARKLSLTDGWSLRSSELPNRPAQTL